MEGERKGREANHDGGRKERRETRVVGGFASGFGSRRTRRLFIHIFLFVPPSFSSSPYLFLRTPPSFFPSFLSPFTFCPFPLAHFLSPLVPSFPPPFPLLVSTSSSPSPSSLSRLPISIRPRHLLFPTCFPSTLDPACCGHPNDPRDPIGCSFMYICMRMYLHPDLWM